MVDRSGELGSCYSLHSHWPKLVGIASPPDLYVLAIGVSRYQDTDIPPLAYADDDARALVQWADSQKGKVYRDVHTRLIVERQATRRDIISALVEFLKPASPQDQVILFLGGHGVVESETGAYHFLTYDTDRNEIAGTALEQDDILKKLETGQRKHDRVLVLMDTCQSGALADALPQEGRGLFVASDAPRSRTNGCVPARVSGPSLPLEPPAIERRKALSIASPMSRRAIAVMASSPGLF